MELSMTLREDQRSPVYGPHEDEDIEELQTGRKFASEDDFEESMYEPKLHVTPGSQEYNMCTAHKNKTLSQNYVVT
ncbi:hypothetical protein H5410_020835 [Solanum commersonii]|uniref:Uncharacterized protein n=1 Tax=Solanum commersonii TaxID=4109 RepID=A0A9J5ZA84_SOLCO|nr:hypothetical protein H5410_020835 [Solanum commersonii]